MGLGGVGDADFEAGDGAVGYCCGGCGGGFAEGGGEEELAACYGGEEVGAAPAEQGEGAGHEGGQGLHGRGALTDRGEEHGHLEDAEAVGRGHVEQAGPGELLPGIRGT